MKSIHIFVASKTGEIVVDVLRGNAEVDVKIVCPRGSMRLTLGEAQELAKLLPIALRAFEEGQK